MRRKRIGTNAAQHSSHGLSQRVGVLTIARVARPVAAARGWRRVRAFRATAILTSVLGDEELNAIDARCAAASPGPWKSFVEGRDHWSGDDFIRVSGADDAPDMYVSRAGAGAIRPASVSDLDFIAAARQDIPALVAEIRRLRADND